MADVKCPSCGKVNPEELEICQFCGTLLKQQRTEPLEPLQPGQFPERKATADLERTLPGWLRDARKAANEPSTSPIPQVKLPQATPPVTRTPPPPAKKAPASPLDLLAGLSQAGEEEEEVPDWLKSIRGSTPAPTPAAAPAPAQPVQPESTSNWLAGLQETPAEAETEKAPQPESWGFSSEPATFNFDETENEAPAQIGGDTPDWLTALQAQEMPAPPSPEPPSTSFTAPIGLETVETPDWLASLGGIGTVPSPIKAEPVQPEPAPSAGAETPDWLASLGGGFEAPSQAPAAGSAPAPVGGELPDWLADLQGAPAAGHETPAPATFETPASDLPDWMSDLQPAPAVETPETSAPATFETPSGDLPDWMSGLQAAPAADIPETLASTTFETPASDLPDWMSGLQAAPAAETPEISAPATFETPASDLPDWMSGLQAAPAAETPEISAPATLEIPASELPDWMSGLRATPAAETPETSAPATFEIPASDLPDWMSGLQTAPEAETPEPATPAVELPTDSDLPDWLSTAVGDKPAAPTSTPPPAEKPKKTPKPFPTGSLEEIKPLSQGEALPDFMSGLAPASSEKQPEPAQMAEPGDLPDWLTGMAAGVAATALGAETQAPAAPEEPAETEPAVFEAPATQTDFEASASISSETQNIESLLSMDMPDWLSGFTPPSEATQPAAETPAEADDLRPADLPSWVQAMRPVESMISGTTTEGSSEGDVEQKGPLAGFRSVLPVQAELLEIRKPKAYSIKIQMSETQRSQAALLERLLASENVSRPVGKPETANVVRPLRWIIFAALLVAVLIPAVLGTRAFPAPNLPTGAGNPFTAFYDTVENTLSAGSPVLVVTDYQPGFAGEVEQAAVPVITHLMRKNAQIVFLSTSPISTEMGERLVQKSLNFFAKNQTVSPVYVVNQQYLFLGYLPGGAAGVKAFAEQPQKTTGVDSVMGDLWQSTMLKDKQIVNLSGFAAVIVITDDPDNGRLWIEQTSGTLNGKPLLMVTSAQAGPMIQPYATSRQLTGLLTGVEGGALYEKRDARPGEIYPGHTKALYWDGFGVAVIVTELAILVGALWSVVEKFRARQDELEQDEA